MSSECDSSEEATLITVTQVKKLFRITDKMMQHLTPVCTYKRMGQRHPIKLYSVAEVGAFLESSTGIQLMAEADERRNRFWGSMQRLVQQEED